MNDDDGISQRPWGMFHKLHQDAHAWVKRIEVNPNSRLSLQKHAHRWEKWVIVAGTGLAIVDDVHIPVRLGTVVDVPLGAIHRIANTGTDKLVFIEVAGGKTLSEDDIVRLEDDYSRR